MTRISRISTPRATLAAFALIACVMAGFGMFVEGGHVPPTSDGQMANQALERPTEKSNHCRTPKRVPVVAMNRHREARDGNDDVWL